MINGSTPVGLYRVEVYTTMSPYIPPSDLVWLADSTPFKARFLDVYRVPFRKDADETKHSTKENRSIILYRPGPTRYALARLLRN